MGVLCSAISSRHLVGFDYDGHHRIVEPHCHGAGPGGQQFLRAYQVAGHSATGHLGWKLFDLSRIAKMRTYDETFITRPDYRADDVAMHPVHCSV
jgi:hypothetical protein